MDFSYLLEREQISLGQAKSANSFEAHIAHQGLARGYAARLCETSYRNAGTPAASSAA